MDRTKTKGFVVFAVGLASAGFLVSGLIGVWNLATAPAPAEKPASSQDAQVTAQENGFLAVLKDEPKNTNAIKGMEAVVGYYLQKKDNQKAIQSLEKLIAAAPKAQNLEAYNKKLAELTQPAKASTSASPAAK